MTGSARAVAEALLAHQHLILTSHARPDGDAVGSSMALALALESLHKSVTVVLRDPVPTQYATFAGVERIRIATEVGLPRDAVVYLECSDPTRADIGGLGCPVVVNVDHHLGNALYGSVNWYDPSAAACGEQVADVIDALGVTWSRAIAEHLYLAIATDTGSFRYGPVTQRTFDACRRIAATGVSTSDLARQIFDSFTIGRVQLTGAILGAMTLHHGNRLAVLGFDDALLASCGASPDDTEGLVNLPLGAREVVAVALFKRQSDQTCRVSLRSKGAVDVRHVAARWGGGGHVNASGFTISAPPADLRDTVVRAMGEALEDVD